MIRMRGISLCMLLTLPCLLSLPFLNAQSPPAAGISARSLDALLQDYAFRAIFRPRTGVPYDGQVPSNLTGIKVSALRLRSNSLRRRGLHSYKEFQVPIGVVEQPYVERLVLVYHNLANWSEEFYPLPGYSYLAPVFGLLAYSAADLSAIGLPELDIRASDKPILIKFSDMKPIPSGSIAKCVHFDLHGSVQFDKLSDENLCSTSQHGHFSIVVESNAPPAPAAGAGVEDGEKKNKSWVWIIVGSFVGGIVLLIILALMVARVRKSQRRTKIQQMEWAEDNDSETLEMKSVGDTKAPLAVGTRTRPIIEEDYIP